MKGFALLLVGGFAAAISVMPARATETKHIAITTIVEVPQLLEVKNGLLKGLTEAGYVEGKNLIVDYQSAQGEFATAQQIARKFVGESPDVIFSISTPSTETVAAATKTIPIIFAPVTDPIASKVIKSFEKPGGNVTGVSDFAPIAQQLDLMKKIIPNLKRLGFVYNPGLDSSLSYLRTIKVEAQKRGWTVVEAAAPNANDVIGAMRNLVGKTDAVYIPNDTTVVTALEAIVKVAQQAHLPVFTGETRGVQRGAVASLSYNYTDVGLVAAELVERVFKGEKPADIGAIRMADVAKHLQLVINKTSAEKMGVTISADLLKQADKVY